DVGGLAEAVDHEQTGLVVPPEDPVALAQAILRYLNDDLKKTFEENIERERERFSWERLVEHLEALARLAAREAHERFKEGHSTMALGARLLRAVDSHVRRN
ncbi:MAG: glycosyltransferase, partial [Chloroflexota bacterium]